MDIGIFTSSGRIKIKGELVLNHVEGNKFFYKIKRLFLVLLPIFQHSLPMP
jgi:hypothetical protein